MDMSVLSNLNSTKQLQDAVDMNATGDRFEAYCDANKGGEFDGPDKGKPRYGFILVMNGLPILYKSTTVGVAIADPKLEESHADTSTGATETYAIGNFTHALLSLKHKCHDLGIDWPTPLTIMTDNIAAERFAEGAPPPRSKLQHIAQHQEWVTLMRNHKLFSVQHVNTKENLADIFTKPVAHGVLVHLRNKLMSRTH